MAITTKQEAATLLKSAVALSGRELSDLKIAVTWMMNIEGWSLETAIIDFANYCLDNNTREWRDEYRSKNVDFSKLNEPTKTMNDVSRVAAFFDLAIPTIIENHIKNRPRQSRRAAF
jgi:hypothetical protein